MKVAVLIPARMDSSRYPGKPLAQLRGATGVSKPLIQRSFEAAQRLQGTASVHVVTDDMRIAEAATGFGADVIMTSSDARNGTERCAEALQELGEVDVIVNLQGDAPLTPPHFAENLVEAMRRDPALAVATASIRLRPAELRELQKEEEAGRVGGTSVVTNAAGYALYFSKRLLPYLPMGFEATSDESPVQLHIGLYAYRPGALRHYAECPPSRLEALEGLEQLRFLDVGIPIRIVEMEPPRFTIRELNNPEDIDPIEKALAAAGLE